jgi:predicted Fe-Mo cluster-binding NifX family protein
MKIAVTSQNSRSVTEHAGVCRKFWIYDTNGDQVTGRQLLELSKDQSFHAADPHASHPLDGVAVLITGGMGAGLARRLAQRGIEGIVTNESDPDTAAAAYVKGTLKRDMSMCSGHRH